MNNLPKDVSEALVINHLAAEIWAKLPPSHQREYLDWIESAKKPETRAGRVTKMIQMLLDKK